VLEIEHKSNWNIDHINIDHSKQLKYEYFQMLPETCEWVRKKIHHEINSLIKFQECITGWKKCLMLNNHSAERAIGKGNGYPDVGRPNRHLILTPVIIGFWEMNVTLVKLGT